MNQTGETEIIKNIFFVILALAVIGAIIPDTSKGNSANTTQDSKSTVKKEEVASEAENKEDKDTEESKTETPKEKKPEKKEEVIFTKEKYVKVFVLSCSEAKKYFASNNERKAVPTDYAIHLGTRQIDGVCAWWLRDKTKDGSRITIVDLYGEIGEYLLFKKDPIYQKIGVRPALWIKTGF